MNHLLTLVLGKEKVPGIFITKSHCCQWCSPESPYHRFASSLCCAFWLMFATLLARVENRCRARGITRHTRIGTDKEPSQWGEIRRQREVNTREKECQAGIISAANSHWNWWEGPEVTASPLRREKIFQRQCMIDLKLDQKRILHGRKCQKNKKSVFRVICQCKRSNVSYCIQVLALA